MALTACGLFQPTRSPHRLSCLSPGRHGPFLRLLPRLVVSRQPGVGHMPVTCSSWRDEDPFGRRGGRPGGPGRRSGRPPGINITINERSLAEYALPAAGLLAVALIAGPIVGGFVFAALGLGVALSAAAAAFALSWTLLPLLMLGGLPLLVGAALFGGLWVPVGGLLIANLFKLGALGAALWLGAKFAQTVLGTGASSDGRTRAQQSIDPDGTIDVDARTVDDEDWREEMFREQRDRERELRDFDSELRRRENFRKGRDRL